MIDYKRKLKIAISVVMVAAFLVTSLLAVAVDVTATGSEAPLSGDGLGAGTVPGAPRNLVADKGPGFVWLWWDHPATNGDQLIKKYYIYRGTSQGTETLLDWTYVGATQYGSISLDGLNFYNDTTAVVGPTYWYRITASSDVGNSSYSNEVSATPSVTGTTPSAPNLVASNQVYAAQLNWSEPTSAGSTPVRFYYLEQGSSGLTTVSFKTNGFYDDVAPGVTYTYHVRAVNSYGKGAQATTSIFVGGTGNVPSAPTLTATGENGQVWLSWTAPTNPSAIGFTSFNVYRSFPGSSSFTLLTTVTVTSTYSGSFVDNTVSNGNTYYYKVTAVNANGPSADSNIASATPEDPGFKFSAYPGNGMVLLQWEPNDTIYFMYNIYRSTTPGGQGSTPLTTIPAFPSTWIDNSTTNGQTYYYKIQGVGSPNGPLSEEVSATPGTGSAPSSPNLLASPDDGGVALYATTNSSSIILWWEIFRGDTSGGQDPTPYENYSMSTMWMIFFGLNFKSLIYFDSDVIDDVNYYYTVRVHNMYGWSDLSNEAMAFSSPTGDVPDPVTDLAASTGANDGIHLTWSSPTYQGTANMLNYLLLRNSSTPQQIGGVWFNWTFVGLDPFGTDISIFLLYYTYYDLGPRSYLDTQVVSGVTYQYAVMAMNVYGGGFGFSNLASGRMGSSATPPSAPQNLVAENGIGQVTLTWLAPASSGSSPITGYQIFRGTTSGGEGTTPIDSVGAGATSYTDDAAPGTYYYVVKAVNAVGLSPASNEVQGNSIAAQPPGPPTNLAAAGHNGYVILTWDAPSSSGSSSVTRYDVFRGTTAGSIGSTPIGNVPVGTLTYNDTTVTNGQAYFYQVKAVNTEGSSPASNTATATPSGPSAPTAPRNLAAMGHDGYVILTWDAPTSPGTSAITRYDVFRGASAGSIGTTPIGNVAAGTLTYNDTTVTNGNTYFYVVKAVNDVGSSPASNTAQATPSVAGTAPGAPTNLDAVGQVGAIVLTWDAPSDVGSGVTSYLVFRATTSNGQGTTPSATLSGGQLTYTDSSAVVGTPYFYKVKASNSFGDSAFSNEDSATATEQPSGTPSYPQNLVATPGESKVTLTWQAPADDGGSDITGYKIYRGPVEGTASLIGTVGAGILTYEDTTGTVGATYSYHVVATNANGAGAESAIVNAASQEDGGDDGGTDNTMLYIGIAVVALIAIAVVAFLLMRPKK